MCRSQLAGVSGRVKVSLPGLSWVRAGRWCGRSSPSWGSSRRGGRHSSASWCSPGPPVQSCPVPWSYRCRQLQLRHPGAQHHGKQVGMLPDGQVGLIAHLLEPEKQIRRENAEESVYTIPLVASEFSSLKKSVPSIHLAIEIYSLCWKWLI